MKGLKIPSKFQDLRRIGSKVKLSNGTDKAGCIEHPVEHQQSRTTVKLRVSIIKVFISLLLLFLLLLLLLLLFSDIFLNLQARNLAATNKKGTSDAVSIFCISNFQISFFFTRSTLMLILVYTTVIQ